MNTHTGLTERAERLLKTLIDRYIREGQAVGSRVLARESGMDVSPATVRNVMADLEEMGLVASPHTSSGRIPTAKGYRLFVDSLLTVRPLPEREVASLQERLSAGEDLHEVLESASSLLSEITKMAGVVRVPRREQITLRQVEFLPLSDNRILVILVVNEREVQNRIIRAARTFSESELQQMSNYLTQEFAGRDLREVRDLVLKQMRDMRERVNRLMLNAIEVAGQAFADEREGDADDFLMAGHTNLMSYAEMSDVGKLRQLFDAFSQKQDILHLLDQSLQAEGVQLFIGEESGYDVLDECSVVTSSYHDEEGQILGVLGVIGPTRMAYDRVIPIVDVAARLVGAALNRSH